MKASICPLKVDGNELNRPNLTQTGMALEILSRAELYRNRFLAVCSSQHIPDGQGAEVLQENYWLCGYRVYLSLPGQWTGLCSLVLSS